MAKSELSRDQKLKKKVSKPHSDLRESAKNSEEYESEDLDINID